MQMDSDSLSILLTNAVRAFEMLVAWSNVHLMKFGLDTTTIITRGPTLVLMGLAVAAMRYASSRMFSSANEHETLGHDLFDGGRASVQPVYVLSSQRNRERSVSVTFRKRL